MKLEWRTDPDGLYTYGLRERLLESDSYARAELRPDGRWTLTVRDSHWTLTCEGYEGGEAAVEAAAERALAVWPDLTGGAK